MSVDLDLFLLSSCSEHTCLRASTGTSTEVIDWPDAPPGTYVVVVDGFNGAQGAYDLQVQCATTYELELLVEPSQVYVDQAALLTANVFETSGRRAIADGTPITFTTSLGAIDPSVAHTVSGVATATLSCTSVDTGTAYITASLNISSSATATVDFLGPWPYSVYLPLVWPPRSAGIDSSDPTML